MIVRLSKALIIGTFLALLPAARASATEPPTKLEQLNQREKHLIEKLEAAQQRERDIQSRLDEVRRRKAYLLNKQAVRKPGHHEATPAPTPSP